MSTKRKTRKRDSHRLFWASYGVLVAGCMIIGCLIGLVFGYAVDLPRVEELQQNQPNVISFVYSEDGRVLGQFALERRILVSYEEVPEIVKQAILAGEDEHFFSHPGIDFRRLLATAVLDLLRGEWKGGSTLTMQLSKLRFTSAEKTFERKIKDFLYAIDIEKSYSKEQIFTFYINQIPMGHGRFGIAAAADFYFHKSLDELTLSEAALLAGIIQLPGRYSPINHPDRAIRRRNYVLNRMREVGYITDGQLAESRKAPLVVMGRDDQQSPAPYFVEWVRQYLERQYQTAQIWQGGLRVYTTVDYDMQVAADHALGDGLRAFDRKTRRWAGPEDNILDRGETLEDYSHPDWKRLFYKGQMIHGLVLESNPDSALVKLGSYTATITPDEIAWTKKRRLNQVLKAGDVAVFTLMDVDRSNRVIEAVLDQVPEVQGAVFALDNRTGAVRVMIGGFDFELSKFNRATQAQRQPGSIFKPFTYVAAMEAGFSPNDQVLDNPVQFEDALGRPYVPSNWDDEFKGLITIRQALAESRNVPTVRLANALGPQRIAEVAKRFGLKRDFPPYLSIALGSVEVTLEEIVSAFSCFPNHGVRAEPYFIDRVEDSNGSVLEEHQPRVHDAVISTDVADKMLYLMQEVVRSGSGRPVRVLGRPIGGKTGTTNESTDTWFVGFTARITAGVWVGYDEKKSLGEKVYGNTLALPIWLSFMKEAMAGRPVEQFESNYRPDREEAPRIIDTGGSSEALVRTEEKPVPAAPAKKPFQVEDISPPPSF